MRLLFAGARGLWIAAILHEARRLVERGWVQNAQARAARQGPHDIVTALASDAIAFSLEGAIRLAVLRAFEARGAIDMARMRAAREFAEMACEAELKPRHVIARWPLAEFNDDPETTREDVLAVLKRAQERCEREGAQGT